MRGKIHKLKTAGAAVIVALAAIAPYTARGADVTGEQVRTAVRAGVARLRQSQRADGSWVDGGHRGGTTALCLLAMLNAGVPPDDAAITRGINSLLGVRDTNTYVVSLKCQVLAAVNNPKYRMHLEAGAKWLIVSQNPKNGMWSYSRGRGGGDNSNTQFALLGLHEAAKVGVKVPKLIWKRARGHYINTQGADGGWGYTGRRGRSYGSMTAAGVASLYITGQRLHVGGKKRFIRGAYPDCGNYRQNKVLAQGHQWLSNNFTVQQNPGKGRSWLHYYLYALERVGMISGQRNFGRHDWYRQGAAQLVATERGGSWGRTHQTAFSLLFLAKGNRPVLFQKLRWRGAGAAGRGDWNRNINDLRNLTAFIDDKLGKPVTWQTTSLEMSVRDLRQSPILFVTGHEFPKFTRAEQDKLAAFVESGGTLLFEACCGSKRFTKGFRDFAKRVLPEYVLDKLPASHPVFRCYFDLRKTPAASYGLEGIDVGCRTSVFFSPKALSSLWELKTIKHYSKIAFELGTNIAAYSTGREQLADKLDRIHLPSEAASGREREMPRGAVRIARIIHNGDYNADPKAMTRLAEMLRDKAKVDVVARGRHLRASDAKMFEYPVVFMTGHNEFTLSGKDSAALKLYLTRGGVLLADACCGRAQFDKAFRAMVKGMFPDSPLKALGADHPIYTGKVGLPLGALRYRRILADDLRRAGDRNWRAAQRPPIESATINGRTIILYSKYDYSCALDGDKPYSCRGYIDADGRKLALDLFLYAISN